MSWSASMPLPGKSYPSLLSTTSTLTECCLSCFQDIQAEIDAHNDIYRSVEGNKSKMVKALGSSEEAVFLQHRLDDMNHRWSDLKTKSANIRSVVPSHCSTPLMLSSTQSLLHTTDAQ